MKMIAAIALSLSLVSSAAFAQTTPSTNPVTPTNTPSVVVAGGIGVGGIVLGAFALLLLAGLGGGDNGGGGGGGGSSSSSSSTTGTTN